VAAVLLLLCALAGVSAQTTPMQAAAVPATQASTVPLMLPGGLAYDAQGNLFFAETAGHVIRRMSVGGALTTVAGTGVQGFGGDDGPADAALLDSPTAVAIDPMGNLFFADSHNHRIRRVDGGSGQITSVVGVGIAGMSPDGTPATMALLDLPSALTLDAALNLYFADARTHVIRRIDHASGLVATVAGNGVQGFSGDSGPAVRASIDSPAGLAVDAAGDLLIADSHNQRVRRVDHLTGVIQTVAGTGLAGFGGDAGAAAMAGLNLPRGLTVDEAGNLFIVDSSNHRIRRIDAATGQIGTIAGDGTQAFAGDGSPAVRASLDSPRAIGLSPRGLPTLSDSGNERIRQVDGAAVIHTIGGLGVTNAGALTLTGPSVVLHGTGEVRATLNASPATGSVTFFSTVGNTAQTLAAVPLIGNTATLSTAPLGAGVQRLSATYAGDSAHSPAQSGTLNLTVAQAALLATPASFDLLYGQPIPTLTSQLIGLLAQDAGAVALHLTSAATATSAPASYPVTATITGLAAGNYALTSTAAAVNIAQAPATITLSPTLAVHVATSTAGQPTGTVNLLDGANVYGAAALSGTGDAQFSSANLSVGSHTLTAAYGGDTDFLAVNSAPLITTIGPVVTADFDLAATGQTAVTVTAGSPAAFSFAVNPINGALSSPIMLTASGLPAGAVASFNPAYLPPSTTPGAFILTIETPKSASVRGAAWGGNPLAFAVFLPLLMLAGGRRRRRVLLALVATLSLGCGDRVNNAGANLTPARSYNVTVIATATSTSGATLQHTAGVTLTLR
jgi:hypothetical protein